MEVGKKNGRDIPSLDVGLRKALDDASARVE
jgi:hypothetical protein